jgi:hypothetical protein
MKRGQKILISIGVGWTVLLAFLLLNQGEWVAYSQVPIILLIAGIWTAVGLLWVLVYGWRE